MQNNSEDHLEPGSSSFKPLTAIYDPNFDGSDALKTHDNLEQCVAFIEGRWRSKPEAKKDSAQPTAPVRLERQFLPEQMPVAGRRRKPFRHVLSRLAECRTGPMSVLRDCVETGARVKVWTRGPTSVRGVMTGFIVAFDKVGFCLTERKYLVHISVSCQHWNLALTDVDEQFSRRRARKVAVKGGTEPRTGQADGEQREFKVGDSQFRIIKVKKKVEICVRHTPQVLLRGEHVVMVSRDTNSSVATTAP